MIKARVSIARFFPLINIMLNRNFDCGLEKRGVYLDLFLKELKVILVYLKSFNRIYCLLYQF